jgi:hypothetical protein
LTLHKNPSFPNRELRSSHSVSEWERAKIDWVNETTVPNDPEIIIEAPVASLGDEVEGRLSAELASCPDVAFAHLAQVTVVGLQTTPQLSLFVWLVPEAVGSLRAALNLVSEAVARALPGELFLDVLILNSVPELLSEIENADCLLVERDADERSRALAAADRPPDPEPIESRRRFWPFWPTS